MTPSNRTPTAAAPTHRPHRLLVILADAARQILGMRDRKAPGRPLRSRTATPPPADLVVPLSTFQMVGLSEVRSKLAGRWPALAEKVHLIAQNTIAKHLVRGDVFERHGDDGYLVLFATLGRPEAEFKSRVIAKEIAEHLLGEGEAEGIALRAFCTAISANALTRGDEAVLVDALARAAPMHEVGAVSGETALPATPLDGRDAASIDASTFPPPPERDALENPSRAHLHPYAPVWDVAQMTLLHFRASASAETLAVESGRGAEREAFEADLALVRTVGEDLRELADHGRRLPITLAVRHASLGSGSGRTSLYQALAEIPAALRRLVTLEICLSGDEFWTYACRSFMEMSRPLGIGWSALVGLDAPQTIPHAGSWLRGVGAELPSQVRTEAETMRLLTAFGGRARAVGLECAAYGLTSRALVLGAVGAGFRFLAGPAIHGPVHGIHKAVRFEPLDLYPELARVSPGAVSQG